jgi:hypothetical protein
MALVVHQTTVTSTQLPHPTFATAVLPQLSLAVVLGAGVVMAVMGEPMTVAVPTRKLTLRVAALLTTVIRILPLLQGMRAVTATAVIQTVRLLSLRPDPPQAGLV